MHLRLPFLFGFFCFALGGLLYVSLALPLPQSAAAIPGAAHAFAGIPVRLHIARLGIDASIVPVALTPAGAMDVPGRADDVGWFSPGARPGNGGNAVLTGHLDTVANTPGVFWELHQLAEGDVIDIVDDRNAVHHFRVERQRVFPVDRMPLPEIFGNASGSLLQLITCDGAWQQSHHRYDERLVVTARATGADPSDG
jgi:hypothetical protein